ncbi:hypothetical protein FOA52_006910 [Chlamydomonas sp. UWO 241]|nr:hypothetical protein FOA52_006910 [Chlamydomonas sp. UWO 241]
MIRASCRQMAPVQLDAPPVSVDEQQNGVSSDPAAAAAAADVASPSGVSVPYTLVACLAGAGAAETAYLTLSKLLNSPVACPTSGCESVLSSPYAYIFGVPLPLLGMLAYVGVAAIAVSAARGGGADDDTRAGDASVQDTALLAGGTVLATCAAALMYLLQTVFSGEVCIYCYASAALSTATLLVVAGGLGLRRLQSALVPSSAALFATAALLYTAYGGIAASTITEIDYYRALIDTESTSESVGLARRLRDAGARMYGAFWCSHCYDQKETFGAGAMGEFPYVECFPDGWKRGMEVAPACSDANVQAFPTWVINGRVVEGELSLAALEDELETPAGEPSPAARQKSQ